MRRSLPLLGAAIALIGLRHEVRRKGPVRGVLNSGLDAIPFVGAAKNIVEMFRGDFIPDRPTPYRFGTRDTRPAVASVARRFARR